MIHRRLRILVGGLLLALLLAACSVDRGTLSTLGSAAFFSSGSVGLNAGLVAGDLSSAAVLAPQTEPDTTPGIYETTFTLYADAVAKALGKTNYDVDFYASVLPVVSCTNQGGNASPGQNLTTLTVKDSAELLASLVKNGKATLEGAPVNLSQVFDTQALADAIADACANDNWTSQVVALDTQAINFGLLNQDTGLYTDWLYFSCDTTLLEDDFGHDVSTVVCVPEDGSVFTYPGAPWLP